MYAVHLVISGVANVIIFKPLSYCTLQKRQSHSTCYLMESRMFSLPCDKLHVEDFSLGNLMSIIHVIIAYQ